MSGGDALLLTGRPASRSTNRAYESHHHSFNSARPEQTKWDSEDDVDELNESFQSGYVSTGYQTMTDTRSLFQNQKKQSQSRPSSQHTKHHDNSTQREWINQQNDGYTPRYSMSRTRNRYRPKSQKPSECDDSLFGKTVKQDFKEWKAPWDQTRNFKPLIYDSTDRTGHCSLESPRNVRPTKSASTRRPWR